MADCSVDSIVTDPPYELGFMGKSWDNSGIADNVDLWRECLRVLKPGGHLLAFGGSRTYHRLACAVEDAGFEVRDQIMWLYGSGFPKSLNLKDDGQGWGTALKPAHEPIVVARKPLIGTVAQNVLEHGTGALNIDGCRVSIADGDEPKAGRRTATFGTQETISGGDGSGGWKAADGRWPANVIHDGSDEVLAGFPMTKAPGKASGPTLFGESESDSRGRFNGVEDTPFYGDEGSAARFFYCAKASKSERNAGLEGLPEKRESDRERDDGVGGDNPRNRSNRSNRSNRNHHPTVKPIALMRYLVRLVTPPGGVVLDPFLGSGTTAVAAILEGFNWIGCEMTEDYWPIIEARVAWALAQEVQGTLGVAS
jgi:site-specific DNA-methyltransferase (adenine-specific)